MINVDRGQVHADYVAGMSYRELADKYGCGVGTICRWAKDGSWAAYERAGIKTTPTIKTVQAKRNTAKTERNNGTGDPPGPPDDGMDHQDYEALREAALKILANINALLDLDEPLAPRDLKALSGTLLDLRVQLGALSPRERREAGARLRQLEKSIEDSSNKGPADIVVRFEDTEGCEV